MIKLLAFIITCFIFSLSYSQHPSIGGFNVYYGHLHNHYKELDPTCLAEKGYIYGRDTSKLDFLGLSEHDFVMDAMDWDSAIAMAEKYNQDNVFVAFWGYEWSHSDYGHVTVIGTKKCSPRWFGRTDRLVELLTWLDENEGYGFLNHPGTIDNTSLEFDHFNGVPSDRILGIELWNTNNLFSKYYYNDGYYKNDSNLSYIDEANTRGWRLGASGSEDNHHGTWGKSNYRLAILSPVLTRTALMDAMKLRRFYSTLDKNLALSFQINGNEMGSQVPIGAITIRVQAKDMDNERFSKVRLYKNGIKIDSAIVDTAIVDVQFDKNATCKDYFYAIVTQKDGDEAISSPIWMTTVGNTLPEISLPSVSPCTTTLKCITTPSSVYYPKDSLILAADAIDKDGSITKVNLYYDSLLVFSTTNKPYSYRMKIPQIGKIPFTVIAEDNQCGKTIKTLGTLNITLRPDPKSIPDEFDQFSYGPNPCRENLWLNLPEDDYKISIVNLQGIICKEIIAPSADHFNMDVRNLIPGLYLLVIKSETHYKSIKFLKE